jgi:hypothetical protein
VRDPQQSIYDDTGWTFGELGNVQVERVTDTKPWPVMEPVSGKCVRPRSRHRLDFLVNSNAKRTW